MYNHVHFFSSWFFFLSLYFSPTHTNKQSPKNKQVTVYVLPVFWFYLKTTISLVFFSIQNQVGCWRGKQMQKPSNPSWKIIAWMRFSSSKEISSDFVNHLPSCGCVECLLRGWSHVIQQYYYIVSFNWKYSHPLTPRNSVIFLKNGRKIAFNAKQMDVLLHLHQ